jgi:hypothetical protein
MMSYRLAPVNLAAALASEDTARRFRSPNTFGHRREFVTREPR